ncbi:MAG: hypothetical protein ACR2OH_04475, partial [Microthrixaceae bacterium]
RRCIHCLVDLTSAAEAGPGDAAVASNSGRRLPMSDHDARAEALRWADHLRTVRDHTIEAISSGRMSVAEALDASGDPAVGWIHLGLCLEALSGVRKIDVRRALADGGLSGDVSLSELSARDREVVLDIADRLAT